MTLLTRYVLRQNTNLLLLICGIGLGVYLFIEVFDRMDDFLNADVGVVPMVSFFLYRIPFILGQIFPAVFLVTTLIQLGLMQRARELLALQACAVSMSNVARSVLKYAALLCLVQLLFSQVLGVAGHRAAEKIWNEEVRNRRPEGRLLPNVWFREGNRIVFMAVLSPSERKGEWLTIHVIDPETSGRITEIIRARTFAVTDNGWELSGVTRNVPDAFSQVFAEHVTFDLRTDVRSFQAVDPKASLDSLPIWQLGTEIRRLRDSGSNIERLETAWHSKVAYAASLLIMALIALTLVSLFRSLYVILPLGLVITFCYYGIFVVFISAGEKGLVPPLVAAWAANGIFALAAGSRLVFGRGVHD